MTLTRPALVLLASLFGTGAALAQTAPEDRTTTAAGTTASIRVDGELDDAAWAAAEVITAFVQRDP